MEYRKIKTSGKLTYPKSSDLDKIKMATLKIVADVVGATLGPGGQPVLIERYEQDLAPLITKDGVTVARNIGFRDPLMQCVMEAVRDAATRTGSEAGDGTTTATILAEAITRHTSEYCKANPATSPQLVVRTLNEIFSEKLLPAIKSWVIKPDDQKLSNVALVSANGDEQLAKAVMECYDLVGDEGNVTISEVSGPFGCKVEKIDGYSLGTGFEESCMKFYGKFINDPGKQRVYLENAMFLLYDGTISDLQTILPALEAIGSAWERREWQYPNVVLMANGFSESVLGQLAVNFANPMSLNVYPLLNPLSPVLNGQRQTLSDIQAITGATIFDPLNLQFHRFEMDHLGGPIQYFEAFRFRSNLVGHVSEELILQAVENLKSRLASPESELDKVLLEERLGKISGGIARLKVIGSSNGELKERRDRAEDAVCAVRGAIKSGCLPGGCWTFIRLIRLLGSEDPIARILGQAFEDLVQRLYTNAGYLSAEAKATIYTLSEDPSLVYNIATRHFEKVEETSLFDSFPAVTEALKNSLSIASILGTLGGAIVYPRDDQLERDEAKSALRFIESLNDKGQE